MLCCGGARISRIQFVTCVTQLMHRIPFLRFLLGPLMVISLAPGLCARRQDAGQVQSVAEWSSLRTSHAAKRGWISERRSNPRDTRRKLEAEWWTRYGRELEAFARPKTCGL